MYPNMQSSPTSNIDGVVQTNTEKYDFISTTHYPTNITYYGMSYAGIIPEGGV